MNIQVIGHRGMLGSAVCKAVEARGHELRIITHSIEYVNSVHITAEVVINCAGVVKQRRQELPASQFILANSYGPHRLAEACDQARARLIHVSTDCVFSTPDPHDENDQPTPNDLYDYSKLAGEVIREPHMTVRTSFIGWGPRGLLHDIQMRPTGLPFQESCNALWSGHTVQTVARVLIMLAEKGDLTGLLHIPGEFISRPALIRKLAQAFDLDYSLVETDGPGEDRRLVSSRWKALGLPDLPPFDEQLVEMKK